MNHRLIISNSVELVNLRADDIVSIEADGNYSTIHIVGEEDRIVLFQLGQLERMMSEQLGEESTTFIRVGRGLIVNRNYIFYINLNRQFIKMRDWQGRSYNPIQASHESLKKLKEFIENDLEREHNDEI